MDALDQRRILKLGEAALTGGTIAAVVTAGRVRQADEAIGVHIDSSSHRYSRLLSLASLASALPHTVRLNSQKLLFSDVQDKAPDTLFNPFVFLVTALDALDKPWSEFRQLVRSTVEACNPTILLDKFKAADWPKLIDNIVAPAKQTQSFIEETTARLVKQAQTALLKIDTNTSPELKPKVDLTEVLNPLKLLLTFVDNFDTAVRQQSFFDKLPPSMDWRQDLDHELRADEQAVTETHNQALAKLSRCFHNLKTFVDHNLVEAQSFGEERLASVKEAIKDISHIIPAYFSQTVDIWHDYAPKCFESLGSWLETITRAKQRQTLDRELAAIQPSL